MSRFTTRPGRWKTGAAVAGIVVTAIVATAVPGIALTNASWTASQWTNGHVGFGVLDCASPNIYETRGAGKFLQANVLPIPLSSVVDVKGVTATNDASGPGAGTPATADPTAAQQVDDVTYVNPLNVTALSALQANLGDLLKLPLATSTGVYNQYAMADDSGRSAGAAGAVSDSGGIALTPAAGAALPSAASLDLTSLLTSALGPLGAATGQLATAQVGLGAVSSSATLDACAANFTSDLAANLQRKYQVASLDAAVTAPTVGATVSTVSGTINGLQPVIDGLVGPSGSVLSSVLDLVNSLSSITSLAGATVNVTLGATIDTSALTALLDDTLTDSNGLVTVDLSTGAVTVDLAKLFGGANGLNDQNPNTQVLLDPDMVTHLTDAITQAVGDWVGRVSTALTAAIGAIKVDVRVLVQVPLAGTLCVGTTGASLSSLVSGATPLAKIDSCSSGVLGLLGGVLGDLTGDVGSSIGTLLLNAVDTATSTLIPSLTTGIVNPLVDNLAPIVTAILGDSSGGGTTGLVSLVVNEQNAPIGTAGAVPIDWTGIQTGQYDVAAVGLQVLNALGPDDNIDVDLARSSVGVNCDVAGDTTACAGY